MFKSNHDYRRGPCILPGAAYIQIEFPNKRSRMYAQIVGVITARSGVYNDKKLKIVIERSSSFLQSRNFIELPRKSRLNIHS